MPRGLSPRQKTAWRELVAALASQDALESADGSMIEAMAVALGRAREARAVVNREGLLHKGDRGMLVSAAIKVECDSWAAFRMLAEQFGLSPAARGRLGVSSSLRDPVDLMAHFGPPPRLRAV